RRRRWSSRWPADTSYGSGGDRTFGYSLLMSNAWPANRIGATTLSIIVLTAAAWTLQHFLLSIAWAGVLAIASWPIFVWWEQRSGPVRAAAASTAIVALCTILPLAWLS